MAVSTDQRDVTAHRQGDLDSLCALYSLLNCLCLLVPDYNARLGFRTLYRIAEQHCPDMVIRGTKVGQMLRILKSFRQALDDDEIGLRYCKASAHARISLARYWQTLHQHYDQHGPGSILLGTSGHYEHWTCVRDVSQTRLTMADSGDLDEIARHHATVRRTTRTRPHLLVPCHTYLLSIVPIE